MVARRGAVLIPIVLGLLPLTIAYQGQWMAPSLGVALADAYGFAGLGLLGSQSLLAGRSAPLMRLFGLRRLLLLHQAAATWTVVLLAEHPLLLLVTDTHRYAPLFNPLSAPWRARLGLLSAACLLTLMVLSARRFRRILVGRKWLWAHRLLFLAVMGTALAHIVLIGHYVQGRQGAILVGLIIAGALSLRVVRLPISRTLG